MYVCMYVHVCIITLSIFTIITATKKIGLKREKRKIHR